MTPAALLKKAKALISDPNAWIRGHAGTDKSGLPVRANHPDACRWCALGALWKAADYDTREAIYCEIVDAEVCLESALGVSLITGIARYNDDPETTHTDVMSLYDRAIELAEKR